MKATGIVRRIDDLGRVVVPKEIRRTLRIREGDPLEIFTDREGEIILKKYSPVGELGLFAKQYAESLAQTSKKAVLIADRDQIIAAAGSGKKEYLGKNISKDLERLIQEREAVMAKKEDKKYVGVIEGDSGMFSTEIISPIICQGDVIGAVMIMGKTEDDKASESEKILAQTAALFLGSQMEQ